MNIRVSHDARCHCIVRTNKQRSLILATFFFLIFVVVYLFIYLFFEWYFWGNFLSKNLSNRFITNRQTFLCIINTHKSIRHRNFFIPTHIERERHTRGEAHFQPKQNDWNSNIDLLRNKKQYFSIWIHSKFHEIWSKKMQKRTAVFYSFRYVMM